MNGSMDLEHTLAVWLDDDGPRTPSSEAVDTALAAARGCRQLPAWRIAEWWRSPGLPVVGSRSQESAHVTSLERVPALPLHRVRVGRSWLLVAGLALLALAAGLLAAGALLARPAAFACPPGSNPDLPGDPSQPRPDLADSYAWSEWAGGGRVALLESMDGAWTFDTCSNTWRSPGPRAPGPGSGAVFDPDAGHLLAFNGGDSWVLRSDGTWTRTGTNPVGRPDLGYDPVGRRIVALDGDGVMWTYDPVTDRWEPLAQHGRGPHAALSRNSGYQLGTFDGAAGRFVLLQDNVTWTFDPAAGTWTFAASADAPLSLFIGGDEIVYDSDRGHVVIYARGMVLAYNAAAGSWDRLFEAGPADGHYVRFGHGTAYDPVNHRLVVIGGRIRSDESPDGWLATDDVLAFDLDSRTWTELLAPSTGGTP